MWKKFFATLLVVTGLITATVVHAEVKTYTGVGEYYMSDFETPNVAQQRAKQRAEQHACEQAGVYVKSFSRTKNFELVDDEIITMTSGILKIIDVQFKRENFDNNTTLIRATIKAQIDSNDVLKWLDKSDDEKSTLERQYAEIRKAYADQEKQIAELKKQLANVKTPQDEERITQEFSAEDKIFLSNQKVEEARKYWNIYSSSAFEEEHDKHYIKLLEEALELNPNNELAIEHLRYAYENLANHCRETFQFDQAVNSYSKLLTFQLDEYDEWVCYYYRGCAYLEAKQYDSAIKDFNKAAEVSPGHAKRSYENLALIYFLKKQYKQAIQICNKTYISEYPEDLVSVDEYYIRGLCYQQLGDNKKAQADFEKANSILEKENKPYGITMLDVDDKIIYRHLGKKKADELFAKAKELGYKD